MDPFFSIIIPCYNQAHFLQHAVNSVLEQKFDPLEIIIVNDGSTDGTRTVAEALARRERRIKVINKVNGGLSSARNAGIKVASGTFLQFLDSDDFNLPDGLRQVSLAFKSASEIDIFRTGYRYVDEANSKTIQTVLQSEIKEPVQFVLANNLGPCHSIFIRRTLAIRLGDFDETLKSVEDWDFWIRAVKAGATIKTLAIPTVAYRYVNNSMSRNPFIMYEALRTVSLRAPTKDRRINIDSEFNIAYEFDPSDVIKRHLLVCLGVSVMQGKIDDSIALFNRENNVYRWKFKASDFAHMNSYLSFRYLTTRDDIKKVFYTIIGNFNLFFERSGLEYQLQKKAMKFVFEKHRKVRNRLLFGRFFGGMINRLLY